MIGDSIYEAVVQSQGSTLKNADLQGVTEIFKRRMQELDKKKVSMHKLIKLAKKKFGNF